jgi:hypothetical protein
MFKRQHAQSTPVSPWSRRNTCNHPKIPLFHSNFYQMIINHLHGVMIILVTFKNDLPLRWSLSSLLSGTPRRNPYFALSRETRVGWPLLTVETEMNGDPKSTNEGVFFLGWFVGLVVCRYKRFYHVLAAPVGPVQNIFFSHRTLFRFIVPHLPASSAGSRVLVHLSLSSSFKTLLYIRLCTHSYLSLVLKIVFWCRPRLVSCTVQCTYEMGLFSQNTFLFILCFKRVMANFLLTLYFY